MPRHSLAFCHVPLLPFSCPGTGLPNSSCHTAGQISPRISSKLYDHILLVAEQKSFDVNPPKSCDPGLFLNRALFPEWLPGSPFVFTENVSRVEASQPMLTFTNQQYQSCKPQPEAIPLNVMSLRPKGMAILSCYSSPQRILPHARRTSPHQRGKH